MRWRKAKIELIKAIHKLENRAKSKVWKHTKNKKNSKKAQNKAVDKI